MNTITEKSICKMSKAAALDSQYLEEALSMIGTDELGQINHDFAIVEKSGKWSARIIELMQRARLIADADLLMARYEAA